MRVAIQTSRDSLSTIKADFVETNARINKIEAAIADLPVATATIKKLWEQAKTPYLPARGATSTKLVYWRDRRLTQ
jgi:hypothetical protein